MFTNHHDFEILRVPKRDAILSKRVAMEIDIETQNRIARVIKVIVSSFSSKYVLFTGEIVYISGII